MFVLDTKQAKVGVDAWEFELVFVPRKLQSRLPAANRVQASVVVSQWRKSCASCLHALVSPGELYRTKRILGGDASE